MRDSVEYCTKCIKRAIEGVFLVHKAMYHEAEAEHLDHQVLCEDCGSTWTVSKQPGKEE